MICEYETVGIWKEAVIAFLKIEGLLSLDVPEGTKASH
jgi:hypothetical protein